MKLNWLVMAVLLVTLHLTGCTSSPSPMVTYEPPKLSALLPDAAHVTGLVALGADVDPTTVQVKLEINGRAGGAVALDAPTEQLNGEMQHYFRFSNIKIGEKVRLVLVIPNQPEATVEWTVIQSLNISDNSFLYDKGVFKALNTTGQATHTQSQLISYIKKNKPWVDDAMLAAILSGQSTYTPPAPPPASGIDDGDYIYVEGYFRSDGTYVQGHRRCKPGRCVSDN